MAQLRTLEDFINQRLGVDGCTRLSIIRRPDGRFDASLVHRDGRTASVDVQDSPADALWNCVVPLDCRRHLPSGRTVASADAPLPAPEPTVEDLLNL